MKNKKSLKSLINKLENFPMYLQDSCNRNINWHQTKRLINKNIRKNRTNKRKAKAMVLLNP